MSTFDFPAEEILLDPDLKTPGGFIIRRTSRSVDNDGVVTNESTTDINAEGVVVPSGNVGMERMPETEKTNDVITVYTQTPIRTADPVTGAPADDIIWHGERYQVTKQDDFGDFGFNVAEAHLQGTGAITDPTGGGPII
jgi:hypothetical protein